MVLVRAEIGDPPESGALPLCGALTPCGGLDFVGMLDGGALGGDELKRFGRELLTGVGRRGSPERGGREAGAGVPSGGVRSSGHVPSPGRFVEPIVQGDPTGKQTAMDLCARDPQLMTQA
ncbi:uncharacterized protein CMC5_061930 [Chondromyces crocatus]|uniref:Uncharacterized protein n=2 Tax=Chondromyces crocatus TaxID=52 RepID=A0A0K1EMD0_CHOCO|nr:uncharacterized protein CMC5_061930 [Chondromyces crocatus]